MKRLTFNFCFFRRVHNTTNSIQNHEIIHVSLYRPVVLFISEL